MTKVLLVEDDNNLREIYEARLISEGYEVITGKDGEDALSLVKQHQPDLVISDVMMPRISGFEMLDILRNTTGIKQPKVIMLTALGQAEDKSHADGIGSDRYLVKSQVTLEDIVKAADELTHPAEELQPGSVQHPTTDAQIDNEHTPELEDIEIPEASFKIAHEEVAEVAAPTADMPTIGNEAPVAPAPIDPVPTPDPSPVTDTVLPDPATPLSVAAPTATDDQIDPASDMLTDQIVDNEISNESTIATAAENLQTATFGAAPSVIEPVMNPAPEVNEPVAEPTVEPAVVAPTMPTAPIEEPATPKPEVGGSKVIAPLEQDTTEKDLDSLLAEEVAKIPLVEEQLPGQVFEQPSLASLSPTAETPDDTTPETPPAAPETSFTPQVQATVVDSNGNTAMSPTVITPFTPNSGGDANTNAL